MVVEPEKKVSLRGIALEGEALQALNDGIVARGWRNEDAARVAGVSQSTIWKIRNGKRVSMDVLRKVAAALNDTRPDRATQRLLDGRID